ncbi:hypothetical protein ABIC01_008733 [Bradyrhizobium sp. RT4b]
MDPKPVELSGRVMRGRVGGQSKSGRDAVTLKSDDGTTYVLRKRGGPAFGDQSLDSLVGSALTVSGLAIGDTLIMDSWREK